MRDTITGDTVANTALMVRSAQVTRKPIILTEGSSDRRLLEHCFGKRVDIVPTAGKQYLTEALIILRVTRRQSRWFIGLVDADFDRIVGPVNSDPDLVVTELHDLECEYIRSRALSKVLRELASPARVATRYGLATTTIDWEYVADKVRAELHAAGAVFGAVRLANARGAWGIDFQQLKIESALDSRSITPDLTKIIELTCIQNARLNLNRKTLRRASENELRAGHDPWQLCRGHDLVALFALGLRRLWSSDAPHDSLIVKTLRLAFESAFWTVTSVGSRVFRFVSDFEATPV